MKSVPTSNTNPVIREEEIWFPVLGIRGFEIGKVPDPSRIPVSGFYKQLKNKPRDH
jgi:hypothetical protein